MKLTYCLIEQGLKKLFLFRYKRALYQLDKQKQTVAVIISCYGQIEYSKAAISSYYASLDEQYNYVLVVMDDCSLDLTHDYFLRREGSRLKNCCYFRYRKNNGLTQTWNDGVHFALKTLKADYVFLINNDVLMPKFVFARMIAHMKHPSVGVVGPLTNTPGHQPIQDIRSYYPKYEPTSNMIQIELLDDQLKNNTLLEVNFVNGFFMGFPREILIQNPFCHAFRPYYFDPQKRNYGNEDEMQERFAKRGIKSVIARDIFVFHYKDVSQRKHIRSSETSSAKFFRDKK